MGNAANGGAAGLFLPDRVDLPFVTLADAKVPPGRISDTDHRSGHEGNFIREWATEWRAWKLLMEFTDTPAWTGRARADDKGNGIAALAGGLDLTPWWNRFGGKMLKFAVNQEIDKLVLAAETERADAMGEILSQSDEFVSDFMALINARPGSHPQTFLLINTAVLIASMAGQHFKQINMRRRPSQVCAALKPPIAVPGHAAYPSGHATQATLVALLLNRVLADSEDAAGMRTAVTTLAKRIGRNREIAGLHYESDTKGGEELADALATALLAMPSFTAVLTAAQAEWA